MSADNVFIFPLFNRSHFEFEFKVFVGKSVSGQQELSPRVDAPEPVLRLVDAESDGGICKFVAETENKTKKIALLII